MSMSAARARVAGRRDPRAGTDARGAPAAHAAGQVAARSNDTRFVLLMILAICFLATGGIFVKLSALPPISTGFYRVLFSIPLLAPFVLSRARRIARQDLALVLVAGFALAGDLILWNMSFHRTTVANGNLLANLVPFTIVPISYFVFKERIPRGFFTGLAVVIVGVVVLLAGKLRPERSQFLGDALAFSTSIFYAVFLLLVYKLRDRVGALAIMFFSAFGSLIVLLVAMVMVDGVRWPSTMPSLYPLVGLALLSQIGGQGLLGYCLGKVNATLSSVVVLLQPVVAALYASVLFGEGLSWAEGLGMGLTLLGIFIAKRAH